MNQDIKIKFIFGSSIGLAISLLVCLFSPYAALVIFFGIILFIISLHQIKYGIFILAAWTPFEPFLLKFVPDQYFVFVKYASEIFMLLLLAAIIFKLIYERKLKVPKNPINLPLALFICIAFISMIVNLVPLTTWALGLRQTLRYVVLFYIVMLSGLDKRAVKQLVTLMFFIVILEVGCGYLQVVVGSPVDELLWPDVKKSIGEIQIAQPIEKVWVGRRIFATLGRYDQLGTFLCFFMVLGLGLIYQYRSKLKYELISFQYLGFLLFASLPALILTYSRMSWIGFLVGLIFVGFLIKRDRKVLIALILLAIFVLGYFIYSQAPIRQWEEGPRIQALERLFELFSLDSLKGDYAGKGRSYFIVQTPLKVVKNYPLVGVGPGRYGGGVVFAMKNTEVYDKLGLPFGIQDKGGQIDNNWFSIWGETGTLGLICYAWMVLRLFLAGFLVFKKSKDSFFKGLALGYMGCVLAVSLQAFLASYLEIRTLALYFWLFGGIIVYQKYLLEKKTKV